MNDRFPKTRICKMPPVKLTHGTARVPLSNPYRIPPPALCTPQKKMTQYARSLMSPDVTYFYVYSR